MKLIFTRFDAIRNINLNENIVFNLNSLVEGGIRLRLMPPSEIESISYRDERFFDQVYANYIFSDNDRFSRFMSVILSFYYGNDVYVMVDDSIDVCEIMIESLMKLIQQRYGIVSNYVKEMDDLNYLTEGTFSISGLYNLDIDKNRYMLLHPDRGDMYEQYERVHR